MTDEEFESHMPYDFKVLMEHLRECRAALKLIPVSSRGEHRSGCPALIDPQAEMPGTSECRCHVEPVRKALGIKP